MMRLRSLTTTALVGASLAGLAAAGPAAVATPAAAPTKKATCSAQGAPGRVHVVRGQSDAVRRTARTILAEAVACDDKGLVALARRAGTRVSFGDETPQSFFAVPDRDGKYQALARALTRTTPGYDKAGRSYTWPRVASDTGYRDPAAWDEVVKAGLVSRHQAREMRRGSGYLGYRITIGPKGDWQSFVAGD